MSQDAAQTPTETPKYVYRPNDTRTNLVLQSFTLFIIFTIITLCLGVYQLKQTTPKVDQYDIWSGILGLVFIFNVIFFSLWIYRASKNTHALYPAEKIHFSPGWNVAFYFIPIISFFMPLLGMKEMWKINHANKRSTGWIWIWWISFLLFNMFTNASTKYELRYPNNVLNYLYLDMISNVFGVIAALTANKIVWSINEAQEQKYIPQRGNFPDKTIS